MCKPSMVATDTVTDTVRDPAAAQAGCSAQQFHLSAVLMPTCVLPSPPSDLSADAPGTSAKLGVVPAGMQLMHQTKHKLSHHCPIVLQYCHPFFQVSNIFGLSGVIRLSHSSTGVQLHPHPVPTCQSHASPLAACASASEPRPCLQPVPGHNTPGQP